VKGVEIMNKLPEAELEIMIEIWQSEGSLCRFDLEEKLKSRNWAPTTILTMLSRLEAKGYIVSEKRGKVKYYTPLIEQNSYAAAESKSVLDKFFGNSLKKFVACMTSQEDFTEEEIQELQDFLEEQKKEKTDEHKNNGEE